MNVRFAEPSRENPLKFQGTESEIAERAIDRPPCRECQQDIYLGFFFDGTNNNKFRDTPSFSHSNVARLYEAFIGTQAGQTGPKAELTDAYGQKQKREIVPDQSFRPKNFPENEFPFYRKVYIPGVGTPFPDVKDSGTGDDRTNGLGFAYLGEARLCWAMLQVCHQVQAAITGKRSTETLSFVPPEGNISTARLAEASLAGPEFDISLKHGARFVYKRFDEIVAAESKRIAQAYEKQLNTQLAALEKLLATARAFVNRVTARWSNTQTYLSFAFARTEWKPS